MAAKTRIEKDSMGEMEVPADAYYAAQTARAVENFPISGLRFSRRFIQALGRCKAAAARANMQLKLLDEGVGKAIEAAALEVAEGKLDDQFVVDIFQTGSGTSTNMNSNEVIANRACEILGKERGDKSAVHPNDQVNMGQSTNDMFPTAIHVAALGGVEEHVPAGHARARRGLRGQGSGVRRCREGRAHTPAGRRTGHARAGVFRLRQRHRHGIARVENARAHVSELAGRRDRARHRAERTSRVRAARRQRVARPHRPYRFARPRIRSRRCRTATRRSSSPAL